MCCGNLDWLRNQKGHISGTTGINSRSSVHDTWCIVVVLGLMKKSGLACEQTQQVTDAVLCCGAGMGTWVGRAPENGLSGVAEELHGVSQGLSSTAMPLRLFLIISRTGSQKWIWRRKKDGWMSIRVISNTCDTNLSCDGWHQEKCK